MKSQLLSKALKKLIYFESEDLNYFTPFCNAIESIECDIDNNEQTWCTLDPSDTDKPYTLVIDVEFVDGKRSTAVVGAYLFQENLAELRTYEGDHDYDGRLEYFSFETPQEDIITYEESSGKFCYLEGFQEKLLNLICI